jgi:hypothetical protein
MTKTVTRPEAETESQSRQTGAERRGVDAPAHESNPTIVDGTAPLARTEEPPAPETDGGRWDWSGARSRIRLGWRRWLDVVVLACIAAAMIVLLLPWAATRAAAWGLSVELWSLLPIALLALAVLWKTNALGYAKLLRRRGRSYAPTWLAGSTGAGLVLLFVSFSAEFAFRLGLGDGAARAALFAGIVLLLPLVIAAGLAVLPARTTRPERVEDRATKALPPPGFAELENWIKDDEAIVNPRFDRLGHAQIARRIVKRLTDQSTGSQTVAVIGPYGAGKTSLRLLVQHELESIPASDLVMCSVSLWGYETPQAAIGGVLEAICTALSAEVDVVALRGLSSRYVEVVEGFVGGKLGVLLRRPDEPQATLQALQVVLQAADLRLVLWVEDLERFTPLGPEDQSRLRPIRALLYWLDQLANVSVVVASTNLDARFDVDKLARFIEMMPEFPEATSAEILKLFRSGCLQVSTEYIDPASDEARKVLNDLANPARADALRSLGMAPSIQTAADALPLLCTTPRSLKMALRLTLESWRALLGEIDFDDLLCVTVLRVAEPRVLSLVADHLDELRGWKDLADQHDKAEVSSFWVDLNEVVPNPKRRAAVAVVVRAVFGERHRQAKPQGFMHTDPTDYWARFMAVPELADEDRDQPIVAVCQHDDEDALIRTLSHPQYHLKAERFGRHLPMQRLVRVLDHLVELRIREDPASWDEEHPPGLVPLWRMFSERQNRDDFDPRLLADHLAAALKRAIPTHLGLANILQYYFATRESSVPCLLCVDGNDFATEIRESIGPLLVEHFAHAPEQLVAALSKCPRWNLLQLCWGIHRVRSGRFSGSPFLEWQRFAAALLEAARLDPTVVLANVSPFLVRKAESSNAMTTNYELDEERAERLFDWKQLAPLLAEATTVDQPEAVAVKKAVTPGHADDHRENDQGAKEDNN